MRMQILILLGFRQIALKKHDKRINDIISKKKLIIYRIALTSPGPNHYFFFKLINYHIVSDIPVSQLIPENPGAQMQLYPFIVL
jgi:hypothetical protein